MNEKTSSELGMYADASTGVQVGQFNLRTQRTGKIWIETDGGEGGEFDVTLLEAALSEFYEKHF